MLLYKRTISQFQVILTKPTNASSTLLPHQINFAIYTFGFFGGGGGRGEVGESQRRSFFSTGCSEFVLFMCKSGDKNLKTGNKSKKELNSSQQQSSFLCFNIVKEAKTNLTPEHQCLRCELKE